ncbi:MAG TPA: DoxX family protein [bacterium]|nr:DoxX family protein [bacterium]
MKRLIPVALRLLLGLIFVVLPITGALQLMPTPPDYPAQALAFVGAFAATGYFTYWLLAVQVISGVALLLNLWTPLFLVVLAPVTVNILLFHLFLTPHALVTLGGLGILVFVLNVALLGYYRECYRPMLVRRARL